MVIKGIDLLDSKGNKKGSYDINLYSNTLCEFFYPKTVIELNKDDQIVIPLPTNENVVFKVLSYEFIEEHFDIAEHFVVTIETLAFPTYLDKNSHVNINEGSCKINGIISKEAVLT